MGTESNFSKWDPFSRGQNTAVEVTPFVLLSHTSDQIPLLENQPDLSFSTHALLYFRTVLTSAMPRPRVHLYPFSPALFTPLSIHLYHHSFFLERERKKEQIKTYRSETRILVQIGVRDLKTKDQKVLIREA